MLNVYPRAEKTVKRVVDIMNLLGYFLGTLAGICVGIFVGATLKALLVDSWIMVFGGLASAFAVAGVIIFIVWICGLLLWTWSNMADDLRQMRKATCNDDPEEILKDL